MESNKHHSNTPILHHSITPFVPSRSVQPAAEDFGDAELAAGQ